MSKQNIQVQNSLLSSIPKNANEENNEHLTQEINNLKNLVLQLEQKHLANSHKKSQSRNAKLENQPQEDELQSKVSKHLDHFQLKYGTEFFNQINQRFKSRHITKKGNYANQTHQSTLNKKEEKAEDQDKSIIYLCDEEKKQKATPLGNRLDSQQEQPAKTQFFQPAPRTLQQNPIEFHFKKVDLLPIIDEDSQRFKSYIKTQRQKQSKNRYRVTSHSTSKSNNSNYLSQPLIQSKKEIYQNYISSKFPQTKININSTKEQLISYGKDIFSKFIPNFNSQTSFTIKKYKNCIIFSLMPEVTKAIIYYYNEQTFCGNISVNEKGKVQKNGQGYQYIPDKHYYQGYFINGKKNGKGKIIHKNGDEYDGQWLDGEITGYGVFFQKKNNKKYEGFWRNGQYCGHLVNTNIFNNKVS